MGVMSWGKGEGRRGERERKRSAWKETKNVFSGTSEGNMLLQWIRGRQIGIEKLIKMLIFNHFLFAFDSSQKIFEAERILKPIFFLEENPRLMSFAGKQTTKIDL